MIDQLNDRFSVPGVLEFVPGRNDLPLARIDSARCRAELYLHGAHVTSWQPTGQQEVLWLSRDSHFTPGRAIRGGIPICWPWFGNDPTGAGRPSHGFARNHSFAVTRTEQTADGSCVVELVLQPNAATRELWPPDFHLTLTATLGAMLDLRLRMENRSPLAVTHTAALHTYLQVADVEHVGIAGLTGGDYLDKTRDFERVAQTGDPHVVGEVDRVYLQTSTDCVVSDPGLDRAIRVGKIGSRTTVLWNPGMELAGQMADLHGHRQMLCVEAANAADDGIDLGPGQHHVLGTTLSIEPRAAP